MEMKYNKSYVGGDFVEYMEYLNTIKKDIPIELYNFVSDKDRHDLSDTSLHDTWIEEIHFNNNFETEKSNMGITLFGENRKFKLYFNETIQSKIEQNNYMDLITYEIGIEDIDADEKSLVFRAMFSDGEIEIFCKAIKIEEKIISPLTNL